MNTGPTVLGTGVIVILLTLILGVIVWLIFSSDGLSDDKKDTINKS